MVIEMFDKAIQFLKDHKEIALATSEGNLPKLRIFQIMKQEGHVLYFATSAKKAPLLPRKPFGTSYARIPMLKYWPMKVISLFGVQGW